MVTDTRPFATTESTWHREFLAPAAPNDNVESTRHPMAWGAVFAATAFALTIQLVLTLFGIALGATVADPTIIADPVAALGPAVLIWACVSGLISFGLGGFLAGGMSNRGHICGGAAHGLMVWAIAGVVGITLAAVSGAAVLGGTASLPRASAYVSQDGVPAFGFPANTPNKPVLSETQYNDAVRHAGSYTSRAGLIGGLALCMGAVGSALGGSLGRKCRTKGLT